MTVDFGTKGETLERLQSVLKTGRILPQIRFTVANWKNDQAFWLKKIKTAFVENSKYLIIRSSAISEDTQKLSQAGHFLSVNKVLTESKVEITVAVNRVIQSFHSQNSPDHQVFIQPFLTNVKNTGVVFTIDIDTLAPYYIINYDPNPPSTDSATSGKSYLRTLIKFKKNSFEGHPFEKLLVMTNELENILNCNALDIEYAIDTNDELYLFQVRRIVTKSKEAKSPNEMEHYLRKIEKKVIKLNRPHPHLYGKRTVFGVMPDWNPAEMIGVKPRPLSLSLYKELITDRTWAYQRANYGYKDLRSFPLMVSFLGLPYIDVRVSFNSFIPKNINESLSTKLCDHYIDLLLKRPESHDKVEFDIVHSCYYFGIEQNEAFLIKHGFSKDEITQLKISLLELTNNIIAPGESVFSNDLLKIEELKNRYSIITNSSLTPLEKIYWLVEDCRRYGTLPFAGIARAAFIATQILHSLVRVSLLDKKDHHDFITSLNTVSREMTLDFNRISKIEFLKKYGHLRPGTYDILTPRYDEAFELYFISPSKSSISSQTKAFSLEGPKRDKITKAMKKCGLKGDFFSLFQFFQDAIKGREYSKFIFSRNVSDALLLIGALGEKHGISKEDLSFLDLQTLLNLYGSLDHRDLSEIMQENIKRNQKFYDYTCKVRLPPLIKDPEDIYEFELLEGTPNYITLKRCQGTVVRGKDLNSNKLSGKIICIPHADPGYDWLFTRNIAGLITQYGGANSHMGIRSAELEIPAVIGSGEKNYLLWSQANALEIDCANHQVKILR